MESEVKLCRYCNNPPVFFRKISNELLCHIHFIQSIEDKIRKTIRKYAMFTPKDKVVVGLSGGKDSLALLYNIKNLQQQYPQSPPVEAILIDEGIHSYRPEAIEIAKKMCSEWEIPLHIVSFKTKFGSGLDNVISKLPILSINPCTICGTVRRRLLNEKALELKAQKLAIGHNLDDQIETFLQNVFRNDLQKVVTNPPHGNPIDPENYFVPRVKPLMAIPESEIMLYCYYKKIPIQSTPCPYVNDFYILRKEVQSFINKIEQHSAEIKYNILTFNEQLNERLTSIQKIEAPKNQEGCICPRCQFPMGSKREICYYCELKQKLISDKIKPD